jgi:hypothetical protein
LNNCILMACTIDLQPVVALEHAGADMHQRVDYSELVEVCLATKYYSNLLNVLHSVKYKMKPRISV